jgi:hypothetical protein
VKSHPLVLNGKYAAIIWRDYVGSAVPGQHQRLPRPPRWPLAAADRIFAK